MCSFIPFCCCMKNIDAKKYAIIGIACNVIKLLLSILGIFLFFKLSVISGGLCLNIFELAFTVANLVILIILLIKISKGYAFNDFNKKGKVLCLVVLILSGIIIVIRLIFTILGIAFYAQKYSLYNNALETLEKMGGRVPPGFKIFQQQIGYYLLFHLLLLLL